MRMATKNLMPGVDGSRIARVFMTVMELDRVRSCARLRAAHGSGVLALAGVECAPLLEWSARARCRQRPRFAIVRQLIVQRQRISREDSLPTEPAAPPSREPIDRLTRAPVTPMAVRAALRLEVFTLLAQGPMTAEELADALGVKPRRLQMLLCQLVVADFLELRDERFANTAMAAHYLVKGTPGYIGAIHENWTTQWTAQMHTDESIRTDLPQAIIDFNQMSPALSGFLKSLHANAMASGRGLAKNPSFASAERVVDIAGGSGGVAIGLCQELPHLFVTVVDLPSVVPTARQMVSEAALADRITVETADLLEQPFSGRFDIAIARALFQVLSAENCEIAARNIAAAIPCGGELFVIGHVLDDSGLSPENCVAQNVQFINIFDEGQAYRESQYREWLTNAGFVDIDRKPELRGRSLVTARMP